MCFNEALAASRVPLRRIRPNSPPLAATSGRLVEAWYPVRGLRLRARISADPPEDTSAIVLVHGLAVSSRYHVPLAEHLAPYAPVFVPDLPGYGRSDHPSGHDLTVPELGDILLAWMDRAGLERPHLIGNSFGCQVIAELAARRPDRVGRIVLQGPTMDPRARTFVQQALRWLAITPFERSAEGWVLLRDVWDLGPRRTIGMIQQALRDPIEQKLSRVTVDALVVRGTRDWIVPQRWAEEATLLLPRGQLVVIEGAAHTINYSQPAWLVQAIWLFLYQRPGPSGAGDAPAPRPPMDYGRRKRSGAPDASKARCRW
jgi:2-hydroxy-6-oxonona-2,4-dienedioate hydrolase